jgi:hypothetical protein
VVVRVYLEQISGVLKVVIEWSAGLCLFQMGWSGKNRGSQGVGKKKGHGREKQEERLMNGVLGLILWLDQDQDEVFRHSRHFRHQGMTVGGQVLGVDLKRLLVSLKMKIQDPGGVLMAGPGHSPAQRSCQGQQHWVDRE